MKHLLMILAVSLLSFNVIAEDDEEDNPFESYHNKIEKAEEKLKDAKGRKRELAQKKLDELRKKLQAAADKQRKPFLDKIAKYETSIKRTKSKNAIEKYEEKIAENEAKIKEIDNWSGTTHTPLGGEEKK